MMADKSSQLEFDTAQNRSDIDYLMLVTDSLDALNEEGLKKVDLDVKCL